MISTRIENRIRRLGRGAVFTPTDFLDLGGRDVVDQTLSRLVQRGGVRRLARGIYDYPKSHPSIGVLSPNVDDVANAIARVQGHVLQISTAEAANAVGLSTQVPAQRLYLTDGPTRTKVVGGQTLHLRHASAKTLIGAGQVTGLVFQALRYVGKTGITDQVIDKLRQVIDDDDDKAALLEQSVRVPAWMQPVAQQIVADA